ncbi:transferrin receptor-like dimerization domain-containing protein [Rhizosphaericola mali]|uniref:M28 family peptidase n=1 Tax=Rhizosphaericola mali TaxID=2545455 RepID=A0A5P2G3B7_9BACT|nr:transferrin receptor-like dimerization domain-containing protein [Rhizosphaericola mali]QES88300.1 M28 family peptidase [Rhizosphaericola mali]
MRKLKRNLLFLSTLFTVGIHAQIENAELEKKFDNQLSKEHIGQLIKEFSATPHHLGSKRTKEIAEKINALFQQWGWNSSIETYYVLFPTPKHRALTLLSPVKYNANLLEKTFVDDSINQANGGLPPYNAWSADGDVTGNLVFVNYGLPEDYEILDRLGVDVKGKIVIAKYGKAWRGIKGKIAQEHGAIGTILYSDPSDDGFTKGDTYPKGPYKNEWSVQRGSVMDMVVYPGDPLTPGEGAVKDAKRIKRQDATNLLKIPVLPINYRDAQNLLQALSGKVVPSEWQGALPITYHIGGENDKVHLSVSFDWKIVLAYDVIAKIEGKEFPNEWVIRGNHHDAWVNGASDPVSGLSAMLEEAKSIGQLHQAGWQPNRTIVYAAWDGEEPSLLGSTEWVERHADELQKKTVAYINSDNNGKGFLSVGGSHALQGFINHVADDISDPVHPISLLERKKLHSELKRPKSDTTEKFSTEIGALGTGSDYSAFLQHLGIPSLNLSFQGEDPGGEYHTDFDTYADFIRFKDPGFLYAEALSKVGGHAVLQLSEDRLLPFNFKELGHAIESYVKDLKSYINRTQNTILRQNELLKDSAYAYAGTDESIYPITRQDTLPKINFHKLDSLIGALSLHADQLNQYLKNTTNLSKQDLAILNEKLYQAEQVLLNPGGLPNRSWYKHVIYAPGFYTGYGVKTIPGVREAIEQKKWDQANEQLIVLESRIQDFNQYISNLTNK